MWLAIAASAPLFATSAHAACNEVIFSCDLGDREVDGTIVEKKANLRSLRSEGRNDRWIQKRCKVEWLDPPGCSWRGGGGGGGWSGGSTTVVSGGAYTPPAEPAPGLVGPGALPARRDAWGKRTPVMAPPREEPQPTVSVGPDEGPFSAEIGAAAARYKLPAALIRAVMQIESGGNPSVVSNKGAIGLMQLLPVTAQAMDVTDIRDPAQNIMGGARFLRVLANRFQGDLVKVLSAYHAGSVRVVSRDATPFAATDDYVRKILKTYYQLRDASLRR
jgi:hypothetical protein